MAHDVFISYSSEDKPIADAACASLEQCGIRCWIAPRDILPSQNYGEAIVDAISGAKLMVLVFSSTSNSSPQVLREVERAVSKEIPIVPFRIAAVSPTKSMEYFLSAPHWLDAITPPMEQHLKRLAEVAQSLVPDRNIRLGGKLATPSEPRNDEGPSRFSQDSVNVNTRRFFTKTNILLTIAALILLMVGSVSLQNFRNSGNSKSPANPLVASEPNIEIEEQTETKLEENQLELAVGRVVVLDVADSEFFRLEMPEVLGVAFCVSPKGYFLTSKHLFDTYSVQSAKSEFSGMEVEASKAIALFVGKKRLVAKVVYLSEHFDFAILFCESDTLFPSFALPKNLTLKRQTKVHSIGMGIVPPIKETMRDKISGAIDAVKQLKKKRLDLSDVFSEPIDELLTTTGIINQVKTTVEGTQVIYHDAEFVMGSSGAPLVNDGGVVIGMNSGIQMQGSAKLLFALEVAQFREELEAHIAGGIRWIEK